jgi:hypothetical protein
MSDRWYEGLAVVLSATIIVVGLLLGYTLGEHKTHERWADYMACVDGDVDQGSYTVSDCVTYHRAPVDLIRKEDR